MSRPMASATAGSASSVGAPTTIFSSMRRVRSSEEGIASSGTPFSASMYASEIRILSYSDSSVSVASGRATMAVVSQPSS